MKEMGRAVATIAVLAGCALIAYVTKDACSACACIVIGVLCIWDNA